MPEEFAPIDPKGSPCMWESKRDLTWMESDGSEHSGVEYTFPADCGLPPLRVEWHTQQVGLGLTYLFMATSVNSDYSMPDAEDHPDNDSHYRDTLLGEWITPGGFSNDEISCVFEMQRRYRNWLKVIHPDPVEQLQQEATNVAAQLVSLAQAHQELHDQIKSLDPDAEVPGVSSDLVQAVAANDPTLIGLPEQAQGHGPPDITPVG